MPSLAQFDGQESASHGRFGILVVTDTAAHTGEFSALQVFADAVIAAITATASTTTGLTGVSLAAGTVIPVHFTSITLTSGKVILFYAK